MGAGSRIPSILEAIRSALRLVATALPSPEVEAFRKEADFLRVTVESWQIQPPVSGELEQILNGVVGLHAEASRLARVGRTDLDRALYSEDVASDDQSDRPTAPPPFDIEAFARITSAPASGGRTALGSEPPTRRMTAPAEPTRGSVSADEEREIERALAELGAREADKRGSPAPVLTQRTIDDPVEEMIECFSLGDYAGAIGIADLLLEAEPGHAVARRYRDEAQSALEGIYKTRFGSFDRVPLVALSAAEIDSLAIDHRAGFLLAMVDGGSSVDSILDVCGMPRLDALRILDELVHRGAIAFR